MGSGQRILAALFAALLLAMPGTALAAGCNKAHPCPTPSPTGVLITTGAETGTGGATPAGDTPPVISSVNPRSGSFAFRSAVVDSTNSSYLILPVAGATDVVYYARAYVNISGAPGKSPLRVLEAFGGSTLIDGVVLDTDNPFLGLIFGRGGEGDIYSYGTWAMVEMSAVWNGVSTKTTIRVNGTETQAVWGNPRVTSFRVGIAERPLASSTLTVDTDDIVLKGSLSANDWVGP